MNNASASIPSSKINLFEGNAGKRQNIKLLKLLSRYWNVGFPNGGGVDHGHHVEKHLQNDI